MKSNFTKRQVQNCFSMLRYRYLEEERNFTGYFLCGSQIVDSPFEEDSFDKLPLIDDMIEPLKDFLTKNKYSKKTTTPLVFSDFLNSLERDEEPMLSILDWMFCDEGFNFYGDFENCFKRLDEELFSEYNYSKIIFQEEEVEELELPNAKQKNKKKEVKNMFKGNSLFKGFADVDTSSVKMTMLGLGVENARGEVYVFDKVAKELIDATDFVIDMGMEMTFVFPSTEVEIGDLIVHNHSVVFVTKTTKTQVIAVDFESQQEITIMKKKHPLGFSFVPKIVAPMGNMFNGMVSGKGFENMMPMLMMSQMFGNKGEKSEMGMMEMMLFSQMMGNGSENPFAQMFNPKKEELSEE